MTTKAVADAKEIPAHELSPDAYITTFVSMWKYRPQEEYLNNSDSPRCFVPCALEVYLGCEFTAEKMSTYDAV